MIKYKQLCLFKYRYKCKQLEEFLDFLERKIIK